MIANALAIGFDFKVTITTPQHPDLSVFAQRSPGTWRADDIIALADGTVIDNGSLSGTYSLRPIPLPAAAWMFLMALSGLGLFGWPRRRAN